jgi:hypothetical protein
MREIDLNEDLRVLKEVYAGLIASEIALGDIGLIVSQAAIATAMREIRKSIDTIQSGVAAQSGRGDTPVIPEST